MANELHHVTIFVDEMDNTLSLFKDIFGFELLWHIPSIGGQKLSALVGIPNMKAEIVYLQSHPRGVAIELVRLISPLMESPTMRFGRAGTICLSLLVENLDSMHKRLTQEGWMTLTQCMEMRSPKGEPIRVFTLRTEEGLALELIEKVATTN